MFPLTEFPVTDKYPILEDGLMSISSFKESTTMVILKSHDSIALSKKKALEVNIEICFPSIGEEVFLVVGIDHDKNYLGELLYFELLECLKRYFNCESTIDSLVLDEKIVHLFHSQILVFHHFFAFFLMIDASIYADESGSRRSQVKRLQLFRQNVNKMFDGLDVSIPPIRHFDFTE